MTLLSLFSGIGLHDAGFARAGFTIVGQVEIEEWCREVLATHWPNVPRWADVRDVTAKSVRGIGIDCITGGFPCTDVSVAGKGAGIGRSTRSGLWREMFRLIRGIRPAWIIIENVPALRTRGYDRIADALERIGYALSPQVVGAEHAGAPHRRHRVWIVGRLVNAERRGLCLRGRAEAVGASGGMQGEENERQRVWPDAGTTDSGAELDNSASSRRAGNAERSEARSLRDETRRAQSAGSRCCDFIGGCQRCGNELADASDAGLEAGRPLSSSAGSQLAMPAGGGGYRWPARPGEPQHAWEAPRLVEWPVGAATDVSARDVVRLARRSNRETLRAAGNANPIVCAEVIGRAVIHAHNSAAPLLAPGAAESQPARKVNP